MMSIGEVITMLMNLFTFFGNLLGKYFGSEEE